MKLFKYKKGEVDYKIIVIASSSKGNAYLYENVLIDCGVPFKEIKKVIHLIDFIFISHKHKDHLNADTLKTILKIKPKVKVYANKEIIEELEKENIKATNFNKMKFKKNDNVWEINKVNLVHSVETNGYFIRVKQMDGQILTIFHATDTQDIDFVTLPKIDIMGLECNNEENQLKQNISKIQEKGMFVNWHSFMHLSMQKFDFFVLKNCDSKSLILEYHQSKKNRVANEKLFIRYEQVAERAKLWKE